MGHTRSSSPQPPAASPRHRRRRAKQTGPRLLGAAVAAVLATAGGLAGVGPAIADDTAADDTSTAVETTTEESASVVEDSGGEDAVETETPAPEEPAEEPVKEPAAEPVKETAEEPGTDQGEAEAPAEEPAGPAESPGASGESKATDTAKKKDSGKNEGDVGILVDTAGPGPDSGDLQVMFRAAHPDTYTTANPGTADSSNVQTQLTSNTQNRFFECGDTIIYFQIVEVAADAPGGESVLEVTTDFDTRFGNQDQVGITEVTAFLAVGDSGYVSDGEETISGTSVSGTWSDGQISLTSAITDVEAGETIVVEYHATLTCGNPPGTITGNLHAGSGGMTISQNAGAGPEENVPGAGTQTVPLFANAVLVAIAPVNPTVTEAVCPPGGGEPTAPTLTLPTEPDGITYTVDPAGPYEPGQTVTVTATLDAGFVWVDPLPEGWVETSATTATFTVTFDKVDCPKEVAPVAPKVTEAVCPPGGGEPTAPTLELADDAEAITYSVDVEGPYERGQTVVVTPTLAEGFVWADPLPEGWAETSPTTAAFTVTFDTVDCPKEVGPVAPTVTESVCPEGEPTPPTLELADDTEAITYTAVPAGPYDPGDIVNVVATLAEGFVWVDPLPAGWELSDASTAIFVVEFGEDPCVFVGPVAPTVTQSQCPDGKTVTRPTLTLATTTGITYSVSPAGPYSGGDTVTVTASLQDGFAWDHPLPGAWTTVSSVTATLDVTFGPDAECPKGPVPPPQPPQPQPPQPPLVVTGPEAIGTYVGLAALALLTGGLLLWVSRRRGLLG